MNQQELFDQDMRTYLEANNIDPRNIIVTTPSTKQVALVEKCLKCDICRQVIASAIWDGIKWIWTYLSHDCSSPKPPKPPEPTPYQNAVQFVALNWCPAKSITVNRTIAEQCLAADAPRSGAPLKTNVRLQICYFGGVSKWQ